MEKKIVLASVRTKEGKLKKIKRPCEFYTTSDKISENMVKDANAGIKLTYQREMRNDFEVANGLKKATSGGRAVDYASIDSI